MAAWPSFPGFLAPRPHSLCSTNLLEIKRYDRTAGADLCAVVNGHCQSDALNGGYWVHRSIGAAIVVCGAVVPHRFGQTGDVFDLYRTYRLDAAAVINAAAELFVGD